MHNLTLVGMHITLINMYYAFEVLVPYLESTINITKSLQINITKSLQLSSILIGVQKCSSVFIKKADRFLKMLSFFKP